MPYRIGAIPLSLQTVLLNSGTGLCRDTSIALRVSNRGGSPTLEIVGCSVLSVRALSVATKPLYKA